jgi:predicted HTH transcriptional regulator
VSDLDELITGGRERRSLEYKAGQPWDTLKLKITKTALALANMRGGGHIVIGVAEPSKGEFVAEGVPEDEAAKYSQDGVQAFVNIYAEPHLVVEVHKPTYDGSVFVVIAVQEFATVPVICKQAHDGEKLRQGAVYVRATRMIETSEVSTAEEMRAIIEVAVEKRLTEIVAQLGRVGILDLLQPVPAPAEADPRFGAQEGNV